MIFNSIAAIFQSRHHNASSKFDILRKSYFLLFTIFGVSIVFCADEFSLCNNSTMPQTFSLRFISRLLLSSNDDIVAPDGYAFLIESGEISKILKPGFSEFQPFERKNYDVTVVRDCTLIPGEEQSITPPYKLTKGVEIAYSEYDKVIIDLEFLFFKGPINSPEHNLYVSKKTYLTSSMPDIQRRFKFSRDHAIPDPKKESQKASFLRNPAQLIRQTYGKTDAEAIDGMGYLEESSLKIIDAASSHGGSKTSVGDLVEVSIPKITHRIWITDPLSPTEPPEIQLEYYINSVAKLNLYGTWGHMFWCWDRRHIPLTCQKLENSDQDIQIIELCRSGIIDTMTARHFILAAIDHGLFTVAGNILRNNVVYKFGGLYTDIGAEIKHDPTPLMKHSDIIAHHRIGRTDRTAWWIDHDFMASRPNNPIVGGFLERINILYTLSENRIIRNFFSEPRLMHSWTNARLLTEIFNLFSASTKTRALILPDDEAVIAAHHQTSWYGGDGKSCKDIDKTPLNWFHVTPDYEILHEPLLMRNFNFEYYCKYFAPDIISLQALALNFRSQGVGIQRFVPSPELPLPILVTLTSWPGKIKNTHIALESLLRQSFKPNGIILWLAEEEFPERKIPESIAQLVPRGVDVRWCENIFSAKKLIPALRDAALRESVLVSADDDIVYRHNWLQQLVETHKKHPRDIIAHRTRVMAFSHAGGLRPYERWRLLEGADMTGRSLFPTSGGGMLFPPNALHPNVLDVSRFLDLCRTGDDIFWYAMSRLQGTKIRIPEKPQTDIIDFNDAEAKAVSLWDSTNVYGKNDEMIKAVFSHYDIYRLLRNA